MGCWGKDLGGDNGWEDLHGLDLSLFLDFDSWSCFKCVVYGVWCMVYGIWCVKRFEVCVVKNQELDDWLVGFCLVCF